MAGHLRAIAVDGAIDALESASKCALRYHCVRQIGQLKKAQVGTTLRLAYEAPTVEEHVMCRQVAREKTMIVAVLTESLFEAHELFGDLKRTQ